MFKLLGVVVSLKTKTLKSFWFEFKWIETLKTANFWATSNLSLLASEDNRQAKENQHFENNVNLHLQFLQTVNSFSS